MIKGKAHVFWNHTVDSWHLTGSAQPPGTSEATVESKKHEVRSQPSQPLPPPPRNWDASRRIRRGLWFKCLQADATRRQRPLLISCGAFPLCGEPDFTRKGRRHNFSMVSGTDTPQIPLPLSTSQKQTNRMSPFESTPSGFCSHRQGGLSCSWKVPSSNKTLFTWNKRVLVFPTLQAI